MQLIDQFPDLVNSGLHLSSFVMAHSDGGRPPGSITLVLEQLHDFVNKVTRRTRAGLLFEASQYEPAFPLLWEN